MTIFHLIKYPVDRIMQDFYGLPVGMDHFLPDHILAEFRKARHTEENKDRNTEDVLTQVLLDYEGPL